MNRSTKTVYPRRLQISTSRTTTPHIHKKLEKLTSDHENVKNAYRQLYSQIKTGLLEAEEVFASLAVPLMKLVGLKTMQMADEGRFTAIVFDSSFSRERNHGNGPPIRFPVKFPTATTSRAQLNRNTSFQEDSYAAEVAEELLEKQKNQLVQLLKILRQIETRINSRQSEFFKTLSDRRVALHNFFQKAMYYISSLHSENNTALVPTLKILRAISKNMGELFGSVENCWEELLQDLKEHMCNPMVEHVKYLKHDMEHGSCAQLKKTMEEMERTMIDNLVDLEEERKKVRIAEEEKMEALSRLREAERKLRMKESISYFPEANNGIAVSFAHKAQNFEHDDKLPWEPLKKKRKHYVQDSPIGTKELLRRVPEKKPFNSSIVRQNSADCHRPVTRSQFRSSPQTSRFNNKIPLGLSPSLSSRENLRKGFGF